MELGTWLLYLSVISILLFSPGPSALLCISDGIKYGNKKTIPTVFGGTIAALLLMFISAIGLGTILATSATLFVIIKLIGAFYLIYLGYLTWTDTGSHSTLNIDSKDKYHSSNYVRFKKGFMVGISNPKDLLFFIALFPSFIDTTSTQSNQYIILALTWFVLDFASMFMYAGIGSKVAPLLSSVKAMTIINRTVGSIFIALGSMLALSTSISQKD